MARLLVEPSPWRSSSDVGAAAWPFGKHQMPIAATPPKKLGRAIARVHFHGHAASSPRLAARPALRDMTLPDCRIDRARPWWSPIWLSPDSGRGDRAPSGIACSICATAFHACVRPAADRGPGHEEAREVTSPPKADHLSVSAIKFGERPDRIQRIFRLFVPLQATAFPRQVRRAWLRIVAGCGQFSAPAATVVLLMPPVVGVQHRRAPRLRHRHRANHAVARDLGVSTCRYEDVVAAAPRRVAPAGTCRAGYLTPRRNVRRCRRRRNYWPFAASSPRGRSAPPSALQLAGTIMVEPAILRNPLQWIASTRPRVGPQVPAAKRPAGRVSRRRPRLAHTADAEALGHPKITKTPRPGGSS